tara:strand:+ start:6089 stop:6193 length:105 start_codon:yes stop_codon:yes gene_type:complete
MLKSIGHFFYAEKNGEPVSRKMFEDEKAIRLFVS